MTALTGVQVSIKDFTMLKIPCHKEHSIIIITKKCAQKQHSHVKFVHDEVRSCDSNASHHTSFYIHRDDVYI